MTVTASDAVDVINGAFGRHPGFRALHAKGTLCRGRFTPTQEAATLTRAVAFNSGPLDATFRFSNGSGNPEDPDWRPDPRGLAAKFYLPDGGRFDIVCVSTPRFPVSTPEAFIELVGAQAAGPAAVFKLPLVLARHPEALRAIPAAAPSLRPPASYAVIPYFGIHAFEWTDAEGGWRFVRYRLDPEAAPEKIAPWAARRRGADYLQEDLRSRFPVRFKLSVQIAIPGDPIDDPSAAWPAARRSVHVGSYEITGLETERETGGDVLVFDPTRVIDGIELSGDPVLRFRHDAYSESVARRMR
ncbi:MAG TPA: catalase family peroxidase [Solirubrobacteraceae bacterium]|nr:catalase family peroxidase [Solirubrobacteraceae bacterium]